MIFSAEHKKMLTALGCFLVYGIEVQHPALGMGTLLGLPWSQTFDHPRAEVRFHGLDNNGFIDFDVCHIKPVLYAFDDLDSTINGIVPAIELARIFCQNEDQRYYTEDFDNATVCRTPDNVLVVSWEVQEWNYPTDDELREEGDTYTAKLIIHPDFTAAEVTQDGFISIAPGGLDYLRSQHFAVGLREEQYIRKVA